MHRLESMAALLVGAALFAAPAAAQHTQHAQHGDRHTVHSFNALGDGGSLVVRTTSADTAVRVHIREHIRAVALAFGSGDLSAVPELAHVQCMPGAAAILERRTAIRFLQKDLPDGAELRLVATEPAAIAAIHEFVATQRKHHEAAGEAHHPRGEHGTGHPACPHHGAGHRGGR